MLDSSLNTQQWQALTKSCISTQRRNPQGYWPLLSLITHRQCRGEQTLQHRAGRGALWLGTSWVQREPNTKSAFSNFPPSLQKCAPMGSPVPAQHTLQREQNSAAKSPAKQHVALQGSESASEAVFAENITSFFKLNYTEPQDSALESSSSIVHGSLENCLSVFLSSFATCCFTSLDKLLGNLF